METQIPSTVEEIKERIVILKKDKQTKPQESIHTILNIPSAKRF